MQWTKEEKQDQGREKGPSRGDEFAKQKQKQKQLHENGKEARKEGKSPYSNGLIVAKMVKWVMHQGMKNGKGNHL